MTAAPERARWSARDVVALVLGMLPHSRLKCRLLDLHKGWRVAPAARIGPCLFLRVDRLVLEEGAVLSPGSVFRNLRSVHVGKRSFVGSWNTFSAAPELAATDRSIDAATLVVGDESAITNRHYMDCSGGILIGSFATIAGVRSTLLSHSVDFRENRQRARRISVGDYAFVASNCALMAGASLPARSILAMGAVLRPGVSGEGQLYGGVPARSLGPVGDGAYFSRLVGRVEP